MKVDDTVPGLKVMLLGALVNNFDTAPTCTEIVTVWLEESNTVKVAWPIALPVTVKGPPVIVAVATLALLVPTA